MMRSAAGTLAQWAAGFEPTPDDLALAHRSLLDTVAVTLAARDHRVTRLAAPLSDDARWAIAGHVPPRALHKRRLRRDRNLRTASADRNR
jgi:hypothetical protein